MRRSMRNIVFIFFIVLILLPTFVFGQMIYGLKGGINISRIDFIELNPPVKTIVRANAGVTVEIPFDNNKWSVRTGIGYFGKGAIRGRSTQTGKIDSVTTRLNYLELPVAIAFSLPGTNDRRTTFETGFYFGYGFNGSIKARASTRPPFLHLHRKEKEHYKRFETGYRFAALYHFNQKYGIGIEYSKSLFNTAWKFYSKEKNAVIGLLLHFYFSKSRPANE